MKPHLIGRHVLEREYTLVDSETINDENIDFYFSDERPDSVTVLAVIESSESRLPVVFHFTALLDHKDSKDAKVEGVHYYDDRFYNVNLPEIAAGILSDRGYKLSLTSSPHFIPSNNKHIRNFIESLDDSNPDSQTSDTDGDLDSIRRLAGLKS